MQHNRFRTYIRPHKRGLEQNCLPLALTTAITPAVTPAQITVDKYCCACRPAIEEQGGMLTLLKKLWIRKKNGKQLC